MCKLSERLFFAFSNNVHKIHSNRIFYKFKLFSSAIIRGSLLCEFKNQLKAAKAARRIRSVFDEDAVNDEVTRF